MIEWIVSSAVLILVIIILRQLLKGKISLQLQYALWAIVLVRLLVPVSFGQSKLSVQNAVQAGQAIQTVQGESAEPPSITIDIPPSRADYVPPDLSVVEPDPGLPKAEQEQQYEQNKQQWQDIMDADWEEYKAEHTRYVTLSVPDILRVLWLAGIAAVALVFLISNLRFGRRLRRSRQVLAADCPLPVYLSEAVETPCLFGLFRPAIYVTSGVAGDEAALSHVLAHETTHFRHWDHLWAVLRCVCLAVHWYNPLVWLAASLSRRDAELACDDGAIRRIGEGERAAYGRTLIGLTCAHRSNLLHTATTMTGSKKSIKERIVLIAKKPKMAVYTLIAVILIAAIAVGCTFTGAKGRSVQDITDQNGYTITAQSKHTYTITIPKEKLPDSIYTPEGHIFEENEVVVYETETTTVWLENVQLSNESEEQLYFKFNFSYRDLPESGAILRMYRENGNGTASSFSDLSWLAVTDDAAGFYPHAVTLRGQGPGESITYYMSTNVVREAVGSIRFESWCYEVEYKKSEHEFGSYTEEPTDSVGTKESVESLFLSQTGSKDWTILSQVETADLTWGDVHDFVGAVLYRDREKDEIGVAFVEETGYYAISVEGQLHPDSTLAYEGAGTVMFHLQAGDGTPCEYRVTLGFTESGIVRFTTESELGTEAPGTGAEQPEEPPAGLAENPVYHVPQAVVDYAYQVGTNEISFMKYESGETKTELTEIENMNSGVAGNDFMVDVYRAHFLTTNISAPVAFTAMGKGFYLIVLWQQPPEGGDPVFVPLGYISGVLTYFNTEEMLLKYGSPYTPIAESFYNAYLARLGETGEYPATPGQALEQICAKGDTLSLGHYWRFFGDAEETIADSAETLSFWRPYLDELLWMRIKPDSMPGETAACTFTLTSADGTETLRALLDLDLIEYTSGGETVYWMAADNRYHEAAGLARNIYFNNLYAAEIARTPGAVRYGFYEFNFNGRESQLIIETGETEEERVYHFYGLVEGVLTEIATVDGAYSYLANGVHEYGEQDLVLAGAHEGEEWAYRLIWGGFREAQAEVKLLYRRAVDGDNYTEWPDRIEMYEVTAEWNDTRSPI